MPCVLVVDAEDAMRTALSRGLHAEGLAVVTVGDGPGGLRGVLTSTFDVIVLDVGLPGLSGYRVLRRLRADGIDTPVLLMISAHYEETAQAQGIDPGADGYLVKPLSLLVLVAQVRALLRRQDVLPSGGPRWMRAGELVADVATKTATWMRRPVQFSSREFAVLHALVSRRCAVVSKSELRRLAWGNEVAVTADAVEVYSGMYADANSSASARRRCCARCAVTATRSRSQLNNPTRAGVSSR